MPPPTGHIVQTPENGSEDAPRYGHKNHSCHLGRVRFDRGPDLGAEVKEELRKVENGIVSGNGGTCLNPQDMIEDERIY